MSDNRLKIGITQGDTNGIGWEVILKTLADSRIAELCTPVVYGSPAAAGYYRRCIADLEEIAFNTVSSARDARRGRVNLIACGPQELRIVPGEPSPEAGRAAVEALQAAVRDLKEGTLDALVTGPIDKETAQADDFRYTGHTEYLAAELEGSPMMLMCSDRLRVGLVTTHLPLAEVSAAISRAKITEALDRLARSLVADFGVVKPRIAVLALNPHAGDGGLLGREEEETIRPAVNDAYAAGVLAFGPFAADGFFASGNYAHYDAVLAMYHDQGLAPFKTLTPDGVNYTAGLCEVAPRPTTAWPTTSQAVTKPIRSRCATRSTRPSTSSRTAAAGLRCRSTRCSISSATGAATHRPKTCPKCGRDATTDRFMHRNMARRDDGFLSTRRKVAWMFFGLWAVVLVMAAARYAVHGDMVVTLAVAAAAVAFCIYRLWDAYRV